RSRISKVPGRRPIRRCDTYRCRATSTFRPGSSPIGDGPPCLGQLPDASSCAPRVPSRRRSLREARVPSGKASLLIAVGLGVLVPLKSGDPILLSHLEPAREVEFSTMIQAKGRAVTIDVQERNAVGLWVRPNDHVDVLGSFRDAQTQQLKTVTLLQNVVVLATGRVNAAR